MKLELVVSGRHHPKAKPASGSEGPPPVRRRSKSGGRINVIVPPKEKIAFEEWMHAADFDSLRDALRWLMWYARMRLKPAEIEMMLDEDEITGSSIPEAKPKSER